MDFIAGGTHRIVQSRRLSAVGRVTGLALAVVSIGAWAYASFALRGGEVTHSIHADDVRVRSTRVGFSSWASIIPAPDFPEYHFEEIQLPSGEWVRHGSSGRRTRQAMALEEGEYSEGRRVGRWTYWNHDGSVDVERSGVYVDDVRVTPGPTSNTDSLWAWRDRGL